MQHGRGEEGGGVQASIRRTAGGIYRKKKTGINKREREKKKKKKPAANLEGHFPRGEQALVIFVQVLLREPDQVRDVVLAFPFAQAFQEGASERQPRSQARHRAVIRKQNKNVGGQERKQRNKIKNRPPATNRERVAVRAFLNETYQPGAAPINV